MKDLQWLLKKFDELNAYELYNILQLRNKVFVVEQNCVYADTDDKDQASWHLWGIVNDEIMAYARLIPAGVCYAEASIGRVATSPKHRKYGYGKILMEQAVLKVFELFNANEIRIGAQLYLHNFYKSLGFQKVSEEYLEDGIPHIEMLLSR